MFYFLFDPLYLILTAVGLGVTLWAQFKVKSTFNRYAQVGVRTGLTGAQAAAQVARAGGALDVRIERHQGFLSDHYDPSTRTLRLSPEVYDGRSISSIAVAAHEAGHAIQDAADYRWLGMRTKMVTAANIGNRLWFLPFILGAMVAGGGSVLGQTLMQVGVLLFGLVVLFQLVTLPVEYDASNRARAVLAGSGIVTTAEEAQGVNRVLGAAALTYVAAALAGILQLIYLFIRSRE
jgi:uncharacterized protein